MLIKLANRGTRGMAIPPLNDNSPVGRLTFQTLHLFLNFHKG